MQRTWQRPMQRLLHALCTQGSASAASDAARALQGGQKPAVPSSNANIMAVAPPAERFAYLPISTPAAAAAAMRRAAAPAPAPAAGGTLVKHYKLHHHSCWYHKQCAAWHFIPPGWRWHACVRRARRLSMLAPLDADPAGNHTKACVLVGTGHQMHHTPPHCGLSYV